MIAFKMLIGFKKNSYIAGTGDGIVTAAGEPDQRDIYLLDADSLAVLVRSASLQSGHYMFVGLDSDKEYLVMARDYKKEFEPFVWDYVKPATDLTIAEQQELWQTWQT